ncbi:MAG: serine O-acetyltransferase [Acidimicrobiales bacterium]|jgi:serine O-acetyltransferase|nr:serine O-acetyltransferase [Acidimicrobiales bacterium]
MLATLRRDVEAARTRDPAARSRLEVALCYPGLHALWAHRFNHRLWQRGHRLTARLSSTLVRWLTGVEIHPAATLGQGLFLDHAMGVVIGETAEVGDDVTIYHGVTLGGTSLKREKRHPTIGDRVTIGAGAKVLGPVTVGHDSRIGANAVVVKSVPPNSVVVGVPGQVIVRSRPRSVGAPPDLEDTLVPDLVGTSLQVLLSRVDELELTLTGRAAMAGTRPSENGLWSGEDFSI